jgi:hypothetical protein
MSDRNYRKSQTTLFTRTFGLMTWLWAAGRQRTRVYAPFSAGRARDLGPINRICASHSTSPRGFFNASPSLGQREGARTRAILITLETLRGRYYTRGYEKRGTGELRTLCSGYPHGIELFGNHSAATTTKALLYGHSQRHVQYLLFSWSHIGISTACWNIMTWDRNNWGRQGRTRQGNESEQQAVVQEHHSLSTLTFSVNSFKS